MIKLVLIVSSIIFCCRSYVAFSCEKAFKGVDKLTVAELRQLDVKTIQNLPATEVHKLTEEKMNFLDSEQIMSLPFHHLLLSQAHALKHHINTVISKGAEMQESDPEIFSLLVRMNIRSIYPGNIPLISPKQLRMWEEKDIKKLKVEQIQAFEPEQIIAFGSLAKHFLPEHIQAFGENIKYFLPEQIAVFSFKQSSALTLGQLAVLNKDQRHSLDYAKHYLYL